MTMIRLLATLALSICTLSVNAKDTVTLCEKSDDSASMKAFDNAVLDLTSQGYDLKVIKRSVKKSTKTYVGTGLRLGKGPEGRGIIAIGAVDGSPARQTGFFEQYDFKVMSIDGVSSIDMEMDDVQKLIIGSGKAGTGVVLELDRFYVDTGKGRTYTRYIERKRILIPVVTACLTIALTKK